MSDGYDGSKRHHHARRHHHHVTYPPAGNRLPEEELLETLFNDDSPHLYPDEQDQTNPHGHHGAHTAHRNHAPMSSHDFSDLSDNLVKETLKLEITNNDKVVSFETLIQHHHLHRAEQDDSDSYTSGRSQESTPRATETQQKPMASDSNVELLDEDDLDFITRTEEQLVKAKRRQEMFLKNRRELKKRKVFHQRLKAMLKLVFFIVLLVSFPLVWQLGDWTFTPSRTAISGPPYVVNETLAPVLNPYQGQSVLTINPDAVANDIKAQLPFVEHAYVRRSLFPTGLNISITEKPVWGVLYAKPVNLKPATKTATETTPSETDSDALPKAAEASSDIPAIVEQSTPMFLLNWDQSKTDIAQFNFPSTHIDELTEPVKLLSNRIAIQPDHLKRYKELGLLMKRLPGDVTLSYIDISNPYDVVLHFPQFKVKLGQADVSVIKRASRLEHIVPEVLKHQDEIDYVDLRWNQQITLRKKSKAQV